MNSSSSNTASYLLIFRDSNPGVYKAMSPAERQQLLQRWNAWYDGLAAAGKLKGGNPLEPEGRVVSFRNDRIIDGPFAEAKEAIGGYFLLTVDSLEEATQIAKGCPSLRGDLGLTVEVRPVAGMCPVLRASGAEAAGQLVSA